VFIANAGVMYVGKFNDVTAKRHQHMLDVNVYHSAIMSKRFETVFKKRGKRSAIVFVSSGLGISCTPIFTTYSSTKGFLSYLGLS